MRCDWKELTFGDVCSSISETYRGNDSEVILVNTSDVLRGKILNHQSTENKNLRGQFKKTFQQNDILFSEIRPTNKRYAYVDFADTEKYIASTKLMILRANTELIMPRYLYYLLTSDKVLAELQHLAETRSGTFPQITFLSEIAPMKISIPPLEVQKKISAILSPLDDKIELNRRINDNLEEQARAIFKHWFIDREPSEKWREGRLKDILILKRNNIKASEKQNLPYLTMSVIPMRSFAVHEVKPNDEAHSSLVTFSRDDIIIGAIRIYFHRVVLAPFDGITHTTCFTLRPFDDDYLSFCLLLCDQDSTIKYAENTSTGTTMPCAVWNGGLGDMDIIIPDKETAREFNDIVLPMLRKIQASYNENNTLAKIRDSLIPKLISGEIIPNSN